MNAVSCSRWLASCVGSYFSFSHKICSCNHHFWLGMGRRREILSSIVPTKKMTQKRWNINASSPLLPFYGYEGATMSWMHLCSAVSKVIWWFSGFGLLQRRGFKRGFQGASQSRTGDDVCSMEGGSSDKKGEEKWRMEACRIQLPGYLILTGLDFCVRAKARGCTSFGVIFALKKLEKSHRQSHHDVLTMTDRTAAVHFTLDAYNL